MKKLFTILLILGTLQVQANDTLPPSIRFTLVDGQTPPRKKYLTKFNRFDDPYTRQLKRKYFLGGAFITTLVFFAVGYSNN